MRALILGLGLFVVASSTGCTELNVKNKTPVATIELTTPGGAMTTPCNFNALPISTSCFFQPPGYPNRVVILPIFEGSPVGITLSAGKSKDPDGKVTSYEWLRTDLPRPVRYPPPMMMPAPAGMGAAGMGMAGMGAAGMGMAGMGGGGAGMGGAGMGAAGMGTAGAPPLVLVSAPSPAGYAVRDPNDSDANVDVTLPAAGSYRFSVWAEDDGGYVSAPASLTIDLRAAPPPAP